MALHYTSAIHLVKLPQPSICCNIFVLGFNDFSYLSIISPLSIILSNYSCSVVPGARQRGIPASFPSVSLKKAPSTGLWVRHRKSTDIFSCLQPFRYLAQPSIGKTGLWVITNDEDASHIDFSTGPILLKWRKKQIFFRRSYII